MMDEQAADAIEAMRLASTSTSDNQVSRPNRSRKCKPNNFDLDQGFFDVSFESMKKKKKKSSTKPNIDSWDTVQKFGAPTIPSLVNPTKRPRGRPPLSSKRQQGTANHSFGSSLGFLTSQSQYFGSSTIKSMAPYASLEAESTKVPRPPYKLVVEKVLQKLMISDPVTVLDLTRRLIDCPRDMVQAVLDIMQVLGVIVQHKTKDNFGTEYPTGAAVYSLVNFVKAPCGISFSKLQEDISLKLERMNACKGRLKKLEDLIDNNDSGEEKISNFQHLLNHLKANDPFFSDNPIYDTIASTLLHNNSETDKIQSNDYDYKLFSSS